ncbi:BQ2448_3287 [Microbotryum intermedium]|uniref:BQ2448_3287 protein n=1 Tax=Microbotryum intermedium TaxID=269621 RepID=A0A238FFX1_9BASI|nr:BQ2448_3287 [Microbotryum intermedium]
MARAATSLEPPTSILIVGCGCFGASTALSLIRGKYVNHAQLITILDRSATPPEVDAASSDINKIVRQDYADTLYASLALQAIERWRTDPLYESNFSECGVVVAAHKGTKNEVYVNKSYELNRSEQMSSKAGKKVWVLDGVRMWKDVYGRVPRIAEREEIESNAACEFYAKEVGEINSSVLLLKDDSLSSTDYNEAGGWADSRQAVVDVVSILRSSGVHFVQGEAQTLVHATNSNDVKGVELIDGRTLNADLTILASGAWTSQLLPELGHDLVPTGQAVGTIQLDESEAELYRDAPVSLFLDTGFYSFPPTKTGLVKFAIHSAGFINPTAQLPSTPRTILTPGYETQQIPLSARVQLIEQLDRVYPGLKGREWTGSRLCWYTDRKTGDWLIDYDPSRKGLFVASGGSGHAFKFFPILGDLVLRRLEGTLREEAMRVWSWTGVEGRMDKSREGRETSQLLESNREAKL